MWANCSGHSPKISNHERFAQVAQRIWAIMSKSLRLLTKNEQMSESLVFFERIARKTDEWIPSPGMFLEEVFKFYLMTPTYWCLFLSYLTHGRLWLSGAEHTAESYLKETFQRHFRPQFLHHSNLPGPLTPGLKYFHFRRSTYTIYIQYAWFMK